MEILTLVSRYPMVMLLACLGLAALGLFSLLRLYSYRRQAKLSRSQQQQLQDSLQVERERLEKVVGQRTAQLSELTHHLLNAREDERSRLARNLHDELGALLTAAKLDAARLKSRLSSKAPEALELLAHLVETLNSGIALGRSIIEDLRPSTLGNLGLVATLEILAREFAAHSGVAVQCSLQPVKLAPSAELMIYRLVQEAITNITKYAQASHVVLRLVLLDDQLEVSVRDDGIGFDTTLLTPSAYGLLGMRFRVEAEGGRFSVESAPGQGTQIQASLPNRRAVGQA
jgi:signal transduction histidine kinase